MKQIQECIHTMLADIEDGENLAVKIFTAARTTMLEFHAKRKLAPFS